MHYRFAAALLAFVALAAPAMAQSLSGDVERDGKGGLMTMVMPNSQVESDRAVTEELTFEPWDMLHALARDDVVLLMRHGPTDWSKRDATDVAPTDCEDQRVTTETGRRQMYELGALMVANHLTPGRIVASEWCRNQQTLEAMLDGMRDADPDALENVQIDTIADLNLLLSLQGAPDVAAMREIIADWDGGAGHGPLLIISHFTNIQELTERAVFEGQMLVLDPADGNRVLGQLRLRSAQPDVGHFQ